MKLLISNYQFLIATALIMGFYSAQAQVKPEFMVNWKTNNYAPANYQGKKLPTRNTKVDLSFELVDGGRLASLASNQVRWFVGNKLQKSGLGLKNFSFVVSPIAGDSESISIVVMNYRGADLRKVMEIPVVNPEVVIISPSPTNFHALPYFFNINSINQLDFKWLVNNIEAKGEGIVTRPDILNLNFGSGAIGKVNLNLLVRNLLDPLEAAVKSILVAQ